MEKIFTVFTKVENDKVKVMPEIYSSLFNAVTHNEKENHEDIKETLRETLQYLIDKEQSEFSTQRETIQVSNPEEQLEEMQKILEKAKLDVLMDKGKEIFKEETKEERR